MTFTSVYTINIAVIIMAMVCSYVCFMSLIKATDITSQIFFVQKTFVWLILKTWTILLVSIIIVPL